MSFVIATDSACNLPVNIIEDFGIEVVSLRYYKDDQAFEGYVKGTEPDYKAFYEMARTKASLTTSLASFDRCMEQFDAVLSKGEDLIYIGFSSALSGTYQTAHNVLEELKEKYPERKIYDVDTLAASIGEGLLVYSAAKLQKKGKSIEEVYQWLLDNRLKMCHWFTVDDLFYLKRGGRLSGASAVLGTMLSIKPVMHVDNEGRLIPVNKVIGRRKSLDEMVERMVQTAIKPKDQTVFIGHGDCIEDAQYVAEKVKEKMGVKDIVIHYIEPVIGCHSGPGTMALFFFGTER